MAISIRVEKITPDLAQRYLKLNRSNRKIRPSLIARYAAMLERGEWRSTHQGIAFGDDGFLYDGQHRLTAVVQTGMTVEMAVARGLEPDARGDIDTGRGRTLGDNLSILTGRGYSNLYVAVLNALVNWTIRGVVTGRVSSASALEAERVYAEALEALRFGLVSKGHIRGLSRAGFLAGFVFAYAENPEKVVTALRSFLDGVGLREGDPMLTLRNRALSHNRLPAGVEEFRATLSALADTIDGRDDRRRILSKPGTPIGDSPIFQRFLDANAPKKVGAPVAASLKKPSTRAKRG